MGEGGGEAEAGEIAAYTRSMAILNHKKKGADHDDEKYQDGNNAHITGMMMHP